MYKDKTLERAYIDAAKEWFSVYLDLLDAGYSFQDVADIEDEDITQSRNNMEKEYHSAFTEYGKVINKLTLNGYKIEDFRALYKIAQDEYDKD